MARTPSTMLELGTAAPEFSLLDPGSGKTVSLKSFAGKPVLVMFLSNHCPFVLHVKEELKALGRDYEGMVVAIGSNDISTHPADGPDKMAAEGYPFPYLFDETQSVAKAYQAACTPDFFLFDKDHRLAYRGQLDGSRPGNGVEVSGGDLRAAFDAVIADAPVSQDQKPSLGCNIKWKAGNEPSYYGR
jgi:thiol-disulfide isomerase/thioredoxin